MGGLVRPLVMCSRPYPEEEGLGGRDRDFHESDMDSAPGSDTSEGGMCHDKEDGLGGFFLPENR